MERELRRRTALGLLGCECGLRHELHSAVSTRGTVPAGDERQRPFESRPMVVWRPLDCSARWQCDLRLRHTELLSAPGESWKSPGADVPQSPASTLPDHGIGTTGSDGRAGGRRAVRIGDTTVYSDGKGAFNLHVAHQRSYKIQVILDRPIGDHYYDLVSGPREAMAGTEEAPGEVKFLLRVSEKKVGNAPHRGVVVGPSATDIGPATQKTKEGLFLRGSGNTRHAADMLNDDL